MVLYDHQSLSLLILPDVSFPSLEWFLPRHSLMKAHLNTGWGSSVDLCRSVSLQFPSLFYSVLGTPAILVSLHPWLCLFNSGNLYFVLETLSRQQVEATKGLTSSVPCLSGMLVLHCLVSDDLQNCCFKYFIGFCLFRPESLLLHLGQKSVYSFLLPRKFIVWMYQFVYSFPYWRDTLVPVFGNLNKASINIYMQLL